ncbi:MAG: hypothetical protein H7836_03165 [Magnetococcus sp. YQC-3]
MLDWTLHLLNHPWASWSGACIIAAWGVAQWWLLQQRSILPARQRLAENLLRLERDPALSPPPGRSALTLEALLGIEWEQRYLHNIPNLLLGVGLFFTLLGLLVAVVFLTRELQATSLTDARQALDGLLHSAALKFLASLSGLVAAFLFSWGARRQRAQLEQQLTLLHQRSDALAAHPVPQDLPPEFQHNTEPAQPLLATLQPSPEPEPPPVPELSPVSATIPEPEPLPTLPPLPQRVPLWMAEPLPLPDKEEAAPRIGTENNLDTPRATPETGEPVQDKILATEPPAAEVPPPQERPPPVAAPTAKPAPQARGPAFAQLAGDYLHARQSRRAPFSEKSVRRTK